MGVLLSVVVWGRAGLLCQVAVEHHHHLGLVALPWGARVPLPTPVRIPLSTAQVMASPGVFADQVLVGEGAEVSGVGQVPAVGPGIVVEDGDPAAPG